MKIIRLLAFLCLSLPLFAQVSVAPYITSQPQFFDNNGKPLAAGCVFSYAAGTTTPLATYTDSTGVTQNANPIILNAGGFAPSAMWITSASYKFTVKSFGGSNCASGSQIRSEDNVSQAYLRSDGSTGLTGSLLPSVTNTVDLGSSSLKWRDGWFSRNLSVAGIASLKNLSGLRFADQFTTTQLALTDAATTGAVVIPSSYALTDSNLKNSAAGYPSNVAMLDFRNGKVSVGPGGIGTVPHISDGTSDIPLGPDLFLFAQGAADIYTQALKTSTTSSTSVGSTGIATITVGTTANFYSGSGSGAVGGAAIAINRFATDWETLQPASGGCPGSPPVGQYCVASLTTITASFQKTHTSTPYSVDQWGANFIQGWLTRWIDSSGNVLLSAQTAKEGASTGIIDLNMADSNVRWFEARRSDFIPRFYGKSGSTNGAIFYGSGGAAGTSGPITFENNDTDSTAEVVIDTATGKVLTAAGSAVFGGGASAGGVITGDWGISRENPADIDFGNSTAADKSATLRFAKAVIGVGLGADAGGFKHKRGAAGCATAASVGAACTTTITWTTPFADANYTAQCGGRLVTSGIPVNGGLTAQIAASVTFQTVATTAAAAQFTNIDCIAAHD